MSVNTEPSPRDHRDGLMEQVLDINAAVGPIWSARRDIGQQGFHGRGIVVLRGLLADRLHGLVHRQLGINARPRGGTREPRAAVQIGACVEFHSGDR